MISVLATFRVREDRRHEFEQLFEALARQVRDAEPGNLLYQLYACRSQPNTYKVLEIYSGDDDLEVHRSSRHFRAAEPMLRALLADAPAVEILDGVA
jgi:quinol monooxygenase YgiN